LNHTKYSRVLALLLLSLPSIIAPSAFTYAEPTLALDPVGSFTGTGTAPVFWSDTQKINNTGFDNGNFQPWTASNYNANFSSAQIVSPGFNDNQAVQLSIRSGNLTSSSYQRLTQDLSSARAVLSNNVLLQASVQVTTLTGNSSSDRAGIILRLASSTGPVVQLHYVFNSGGPLPSNTTSDGYFKVAGYGSPGWISINRTVASDAQSVFPGLYPNVDAVKSISLYVDSVSYGNTTRDPRIVYYDGDGDGFWNSTETVVYNTEMDGIYHTGDPLLYTSTFFPSSGNSLRTDPRIKYVDLNNNGRWDSGESISYDCNNTIPGDCNNNVYDIIEPTIYGNPIIGQLLMDPIRRVTTASFDQVQLVAPMVAGNLILNAGFETGTLVGWGNTVDFSISDSAHTGSHSASGTAAGKTAQLAQGIDADPIIDSTSLLQAFVNTGSLTGTTTNDMVDVWLGLSDGLGTPLSLYYVYDTGNGQLPSNSTGTLYFKVPGFGTLNQWIGINRTLTIDTTPFITQGFTPPYSVGLIALELRAQPSRTSSASFDDMYLSSTYTSSLNVPAAYSAVDRQNATYTYTIPKVPRGYFSLQIPAGQSILNITTPVSTLLQPSDYSTTKFSTTVLVNIPNSTGTRYPIGGTYTFHTTSKNAVGTVYLQDASTLSILNLTRSLDPGRRVTLTELSLDPFGTGIPAANSTISIWSSNGTMTKSFNGIADASGFFRVSDIGLPLANGTYTLQATSYSSANIGVRTTHFFILTTSPPVSLLLWIIAIIAVIAGVTGFLVFYRRTKRKINASRDQPTQPTKIKKGGAPPTKKTDRKPPRR